MPSPTAERKVSVTRREFNDDTIVDCLELEAGLLPLESAEKLAELFGHDEDAFSIVEDVIDSYLERTVMQRMSA